MPDHFEILPVGPYEANCVVLDDGRGNAWIVDPGDDAGSIAALVQTRGLSPRRVILTHGHLDHISALGDVLAAWPGIPVSVHEADAAWCFTSVNRIPGYGVPPRRPATLAFIADGDVLADGGLSAEILHTPGHSPGSVCIKVADGPLLSGDTLFARSVGRTDLPGGDWAKLAKSLSRLSGLDGELAVIPGHGPQTTIGDEVKWNPYLQQET